MSKMRGQEKQLVGEKEEELSAPAGPPEEQFLNFGLLWACGALRDFYSRGAEPRRGEEEGESLGPEKAPGFA